MAAAALATSRRTLRASPGAGHERVRVLARVREKTRSPATLAVERETDSDRDDHRARVARAPDARPGRPVSARDDPVPAFQPGAWLSARAAVPFADAVPDSTRPAA